MDGDGFGRICEEGVSDVPIYGFCKSQKDSCINLMQEQGKRALVHKNFCHNESFNF